MVFGRIAAHLPADPDGEPVDIAKLDRPDPALARGHRGAGFGRRVAKRVDRALPGDDNALHPCCSATSPSTARTMAATEEMSKSLSEGSLALKGT